MVKWLFWILIVIVGVCFFNKPEAEIVKNKVDQNIQLQLRCGMLGGFIRCKECLIIV